MAYIVVLLVGMIGGGICVFVALDGKRRALNERERGLQARIERVEESAAANKAREQASLQAISEKQREFNQQAERLKTDRAGFDSRVIAYAELENENKILKRDLQNVDVNLRKLQLDCEVQHERQETLDQRSKELGGRYLKDTIKWIGASITANNYAACKQRLLDAIKWCRDIGLSISPAEEATSLANLKQEYENAVRAAFEREEQARIRAQIREEEQQKREVERELKQLERERAAIQAALDKALAEAKDEHSVEVEGLKARLAEAEAKSQRAISQAQMTKSGHVYVISNIGSFGDGVFKIGMTRRLEPADRIRELSSASVPFPFDVHMMISCDDAPTLENELHRTLHRLRINKTNPRKEFFKTDIEAIRQIVEEHHGQVDYIADAEALQYRQSLTMSEEDQEFIESVYDQTDEGSETLVEDV